jgi:hypothetical protein
MTLARIAMILAFIVWVLHLFQEREAKTADDKLELLDTQLTSIWLLLVALWLAVTHIADKVDK